MDPIPLLTSIPKNTLRQDCHGTEIGRDYLRSCIESWQNSGFTPISVNSQKEIQVNCPDMEGVRYISVKRDASHATGKPLIYLNDLIHVAVTLASGPVVITNADIFLDCTQEIRTFIQRLKPGKCLILKRFEIETAYARNGVESSFGYDFFAFHVKDIQKYAESKLVFGMPWWDHYVPIFLAFHGVSILTESTPCVFHLVHNERWNANHGVKYGFKFMDIVNSDIEAMDLESGLINTYVENFHLLATSIDIISRIRYIINKTRGVSDTHVSELFKRLSTANVRFIEDEMAKNKRYFENENSSGP